MIAPLRWKMFIAIQCPDCDQEFHVQNPRAGFGKDCPADWASAPVVIHLPTYCPKCEAAQRQKASRKPKHLTRIK